MKIKKASDRFYKKCGFFVENDILWLKSKNIDFCAIFLQSLSVADVKTLCFSIPKEVFDHFIDFGKNSNIRWELHNKNENIIFSNWWFLWLKTMCFHENLKISISARYFHNSHQLVMYKYYIFRFPNFFLVISSILTKLSHFRWEMFQNKETSIWIFKIHVNCPKVKIKLNFKVITVFYRVVKKYHTIYFSERIFTIDWAPIRFFMISCVCRKIEPKRCG